MIYKNDLIPSNFNKIIEINDNSIIWSKESVLYSGNDYEVYIQFLQPSFGLIHIDNYRIKQGDKYEIEYNYSNLGYLSDADISFSCNTIEVDDDEFISNDYLRSDYCFIFICGFISVFVFYWVFHKLSYLFKKGGI